MGIKDSSIRMIVVKLLLPHIYYNAVHNERTRINNFNGMKCDVLFPGHNFNKYDVLEESNVAPPPKFTDASNHSTRIDVYEQTVLKACETTKFLKNHISLF